MAETQELNRILGELEQEILNLRNSELVNLVKPFSDNIKELIISIENVNFPQQLSDINKNIQGNNENLTSITSSIKEFITKLSDILRTVSNVDKTIESNLKQLNDRITTLENNLTSKTDSVEKNINHNLSVISGESNKSFNKQNVFLYIIIALLIALIVLKFV